MEVSKSRPRTKIGAKLWCNNMTRFHRTGRFRGGSGASFMQVPGTNLASDVVTLLTSIVPRYPLFVLLQPSNHEQLRCKLYTRNRPKLNHLRQGRDLLRDLPCRSVLWVYVQQDSNTLLLLLCGSGHAIVAWIQATIALQSEVGPETATGFTEAIAMLGSDHRPGRGNGRNDQVTTIKRICRISSAASIERTKLNKFLGSPSQTTLM